MPSIKDVRSYWNSNPLLSHELADPGSARFFQDLDQAKRNDSDKFAMDYWDFTGFAGLKVLDVGCGPGWLTVNYARGGAEVHAIDLTEKAASLTRENLSLNGLHAAVQVGNAEELPFADNAFHLVISSGVLHHTPDTQGAFQEAFRVLKPGGQGKITLYRKGILHSPFVFPAVRLLMKFAGVKHPGADLARNADGVDDFIRQYDGEDNPIGIAKRNKEWTHDFSAKGFNVIKVENHFFPVRFLARSTLVPSFFHRLLDKHFGTMVYLSLSKPG